MSASVLVCLVTHAGTRNETEGPCRTRPRRFGQFARSYHLQYSRDVSMAIIILWRDYPAHDRLC